MNNTLEICKQTREIAANSFAIALQALLQTNKPISEVMLRDRWLKELQKHQEIFPDGWYMPPPHGIAVLFGTQENQRTSFKSLRPEPFWPKDNIFFTPSGLMCFYASPVHKQGVIGDFGTFLYLGSNPKIQDHFKKTYQLIHDIYDHIEVDMKLSDIYILAGDLMKKQNLYSDLLSPTDPTGTNIGHTIVSLTKNELVDLEHGKIDWNQAKDILSKKRKFINKIEETKLTPRMAITLEPRPQVQNDPTIPMAWFHTVVTFDENGKKELVTGFDTIFTLMGMKYMVS